MENKCENENQCCARLAKPIILLVVGGLLSYAVLTLSQKLHDGLTHFRSFDRVITVKGLAVKDVEADLAVWSITFNVTEDTLAAAQANLSSNDKIVRDYFAENGIGSDKIRLQNINVVDRMAQVYNSSPNDSPRFIISETLVARTNDVAAMVKASQNISDLIKSGVTLGDPSGGGNTVPQYLFTKINDIKPELIAEATKNARKSAEQFAKDAGQEVGSIRTANQGYIQIEARDPGVNESETPQKSVRVVTTIDYLLGK